MRWIGGVIGWFGVFVLVVLVKSSGGFGLGLGEANPEASPHLAQSLLTALFYFALTIGGIAAGVLSDALAALDENQRVTLSAIAPMLTTARAWKGFIASPLVFLSMYSTLASSPLSAPFLILAFQNGFFWKTVMTRLANSR